MSKDFFRGAGLKIAGVLLSLMLFAAAGAMVVRFVIGEPGAVKTTIVRSGAYDHLIDASLAAARTTAKKEDKSNIPLTDPIIKDSLNQAYNSSVLRTNFENLIDGTYRWLDGSAAQPDFVLDFGASNEVFVRGAGDRLGERLRGLPACTPVELRAAGEVDAFKAKCLPPGVDISQLVQQSQSNLRSRKDLLPDQKITADTFKKPGETQNVFASASDAPKQFQLLKQVPWMLLVIITILAAIIVLLSPSRPEGLKRLGKNLTITGVLILLIPLGLYFAQSTLTDQKVIDANPLARDVTLPLITEFGKAAAKVYLIFGSLAVLIGGSIWLAVRHSGRHSE